jgi:hypothetical protein
MEKPLTILDEAARVTSTDRNDAYGHPRINHGCTAEMISAYLSRKYGTRIPFDADDVCVANILQKVSRLAHTPRHRDSLVDIAGYARNVEMMGESPEQE